MNDRIESLKGIREQIDTGFESMRDRIITYIREKAGKTFAGLEDIMQQALVDEASVADTGTGVSIPASSFDQSTSATQNPPPSASPINQTTPNTMQMASSGSSGSPSRSSGKWYEKLAPELLAYEVRRTLSQLKKQDPDHFALQIECLAIVMGHEKFKNAVEQLGPGIVGGRVPQFTATSGLARGNHSNITEAIIDMCVNERRVYPDKTARPVADMVEEILKKAEQVCTMGIQTRNIANRKKTPMIGGHCPDEPTRKRFLQEVIGQDGQRIVVDWRKEQKQAAKKSPKGISDGVKNVIGMVLGADLVDGKMDTFTAIKEAGNRILNGKQKHGVKKPNLRRRRPPQ